MRLLEQIRSACETSKLRMAYPLDKRRLPEYTEGRLLPIGYEEIQIVVRERFMSAWWTPYWEKEEAFRRVCNRMVEEENKLFDRGRHGVLWIRKEPDFVVAESSTNNNQSVIVVWEYLGL